MEQFIPYILNVQKAHMWESSFSAFIYLFFLLKTNKQKPNHHLLDLKNKIG